MTAVSNRTQKKADAGLAKARKLAAETVVFEITISKPSLRSRVRSRDVVTDRDVDANQFHVRKDLIDRSALKALLKHESQFKNGWLMRRAIPCGMLRGGMYLLPLDLIEDTDKGVAAFIGEREGLVGKLVDKYADLKAQARTKLGPHYDDSNYPSAEALAASFGVKRRFLSFNVPAALEGVNKELYAREKERIEAELVEASEEIRGALREAFAGMVDRLADRLTPDEEGNAKIFRDSTVQTFQDFLSTFAARDLTNDAELSKLAEQAKSLLKGVKPDVLRKQETTRERVMQGMAAIKEKIDVLVPVVRGKRRFAAEGEEV